MTYRRLLALPAVALLAGASLAVAQDGVTPPPPAPAPAPAPAAAPADAPAAPEAPAKRKRLVPGDVAPPLKNVTWLQGSPVETFEKGQIYVLDFWATWCGPCIAAIPHMTEMHNNLKDKGVNVIGAAIWPRDGQTPTKDFVAKKGDKMPYRICEDDAEGTVANAYMRAAGQNGIPCIMIVDKEGKIAWIGHPMDGMDEVLDAVIAGNFDPDAFAKKKAEKEEKVGTMMKALNAAAKEQRWEDCIKHFDEFLALDPKGYDQMNLFKYTVLAKEIKDSKRAAEFGNSLVNDKWSANAPALNILAWTIVDPRGEFTAETRDTDLALAAATKAVEITKNEDAAALDTLARVHFLKGDTANAVKVQTKALELADDEDMKKDMAASLKEYQEAANAG